MRDFVVDQMLLDGRQVVGSEHNGVGASRKIARGALTGSMRNLGCEQASRQVWSDNDVVGDWVGPRRLSVIRS